MSPAMRAAVSPSLVSRLSSLSLVSLVSLFRLSLSSLVSLSLHHHIVKVDYVQSRAGLMPGFLLKLTIKDSKCSAGESCAAA